MRKLKLMDGHAVPNVPGGEHIPGLENESAESLGGSDAEAWKFAERARFKQKLSNLGNADKMDVYGGPGVESTATAGSKGTDAQRDARKDPKKKARGVKPSKGLKAPSSPKTGDCDSDDSQEDDLGGSRTSRDRMRSLESRGSAGEALPFELVGLEVALEIVCNQLERDRRDVGEEVRASLAGLRKKVDTNNLERVRRVKTKVTRLTGRVAKVRDEIKRYLDDDSDMRDMYLTRKAMVEANANNNDLNAPGSGNFGNYGGRQSVNFQGFQNFQGYGTVHGSGGSFKMRRQSLNVQEQHGFGSSGAYSSGNAGVGGRGPDGRSERNANAEIQGLPSTPADANAGGGGSENVDVFGEEVFVHQEDSDLQVVEDLLETYFAHIDSTYAELDAIDQFINDTEDFVNIQLDVTRNQLQKFEVLLQSATLFVTMYSMVGSIFGMNLLNGAESSYATFVLVNALCGTGAVVGFSVIILYIRSKRWM